MLNRGKLFESAHRFPICKWHSFMSGFEWYQRSNRHAPLTDNDPSFAAHSSDPFPRLEVQIANGNFFHVHNVHKWALLSMVSLAGSFPHTDMKPRLFRREEFETILAAGSIKYNSLAAWS